jgi:hypothetical protein
VHLVCVEHGLHDLVAELEGEVAVLEHEPVTVQDRFGDHLPGALLLTLAHRQRSEILRRKESVISTF